MTHTRTNDDMQYTFSVSSKKQLMEQFHNEQKEAYAITQPLLDTEAGFIKNLEHYLNHRDTLALKKRELLHKRWTECVWLPVQRSIAQHFTLHGYNETKNMRSMHTHYINYCNAKGFVFLETYDPSEYNPFLHHFNRPQNHKVLTPPLQDPLSLQSQDMKKWEKMAILRCQTGCLYHHRRMDECCQSLPVSQHSPTKPHAKPSRDTGSERLWGDNSRWGSRDCKASCKEVKLLEQYVFFPVCHLGDKELHVCLRQMDSAFSLSAGLLKIHHVMFFI